MKRYILSAIFTICALIASAQFNNTMYIDLRGEWAFSTAEGNIPKSIKGMPKELVTLPGTTDTNHKGTMTQPGEETTHLARRYTFTGKAYYSRGVEIPKEWKKKNIMLFMDRTKPTTLYVDGKKVGTNNKISTCQKYDLTGILTPGIHVITIEVDNSKNAVPEQILTNSHACTEDTQTNWNGILGMIYIEALPSLYIEDMSIETSAAEKSFTATVTLCGENMNGEELRLILASIGDEYGNIVAQQPINMNEGKRHKITIKYQDDDLKLWSEFNPNTYRLYAQLRNGHTMEKTFGIVDFKTDGTQFIVNGQPTFLRGKHDACVFPYTAHVPMDVQTWRRYMQVCKGYGINHIRFHSWCPPEAAFLAADIVGIYLQPELPFWGDFNKDNTDLMTFLHNEGMDIIREYGHHPSFVMMALGNELWGDIPSMKRFVDHFRRLAPDKLYTFGSNYYLGYQGAKEGMDYFTTCRNGGEAWGSYDTHTRGSFSFADAYDGGVINHFYPNSSRNFNEAVEKCAVPIISHETGQFQTYPDFREIQKYTGVLRPDNMEVFKKRLEKAGMADQAEAFHRASGLWSVQLYKADIEMDLRTRGMAGFQLLDIQDYPGQGSAYVGILDAFMDSKGITTPQEWRQWCSPVVPLLVTDKFCYTADEQLSGKIQIANYGNEDLTGKTLAWKMCDESGKMTIPSGRGLLDVGNISVKAPAAVPQKTTLTLTVEGTDYSNSYPLWFYPSAEKTRDILKKSAASSSVIVAHEMTDEMGKNLQNGATVLLMPDSTGTIYKGSDMKKTTVPGLFQTDYWNYRMFKTICENNKKSVSPGTLGILTTPEHPVFSLFPTEEHTSWQWFPMVKAARPFILDNTPAQYRPLVQVIDNVERNHKLGLIFEFSVGKGKLLVCMSPLHQLQEYPEARQLSASIMAYMGSADFNPATHITPDELRLLLTTPVEEGKMKQLFNITQY